MTALLTLSYEETKNLLTAAVEEKGADHSVSCHYYEEDGTPECIVGQVFAAKGIGLAQLMDAYNEAWNGRPEGLYHGFNQNEGNTEEIGNLIDLGVVEVEDPRTCTLLIVAQARQDTGEAWGDALANAIEAAEGFEVYA